MQQPPAIPKDTMTSAVSSLTLRLTADGFVYLYDLSDEETEAGTREGYHTRRQSQFVPIDWSRVSALWGDIIAQHPILSDPEGEIRVLYPASHYVVIPVSYTHLDVYKRQDFVSTL